MLVLLPATACDPGGGAESASPTTSASPSTTATTESVTTTTTQASAVAPVRPAPSTGATAAPVACPTVPERVAPTESRPSYRWSLRFDLAGGVVEGRGVMEFTPEADVDTIVVRLWANSPRITRRGGGIEPFVDGETPSERPDPTTLVLRQPVGGGRRASVGLTWRLVLPTSPTNDRVYRSGDAVRLGSFLPVLAWEPGVGWAKEPPTSGFAEASLSVPADYEVAVSGLPEGVTSMATGVERDGTWFASGVPDFGLSVGRFARAQRDVGGVAVTVGVDSQVKESPTAYLDKVALAIERFSAMYGAYPWAAYSLAITPALGGGIEYPMHVMQGPGTLGRTTSHEVAHMWFFGLVATNQGRDPWIDEGLATWAEGRFEGTTASLMARSIPPDGKARTGEPMTYWEPRQGLYYRSVYVQGAQAIGALGAAESVDCALRHLVARQAYRVTRPADVVAAMTTVFPNAADVMARYGIRG